MCPNINLIPKAKFLKFRKTAFLTVVNKRDDMMYSPQYWFITLSDRQTQFGFRDIWRVDWKYGGKRDYCSIKSTFSKWTRPHCRAGSGLCVYEFITLIERNKAPSTDQMATKSRALDGRSSVCVCVVVGKGC